MAAYITKDKDMIDAICFNHYGSHDGGIIERVLEVNRSLAWQGPLLPAGLSIELPALPRPQAAAVVRLWD